MGFINHSYFFDLFRNLYADISYKSFLQKTGSAITPLRYFLELTYRCNLNCPYCYIGENRDLQELSTKEWLRIISRIPWYAFITLVGGEPFLRDDFDEIMNAASKKTFGKVNVVSNGTLLNENIIDAMVKSGIILFSVSLDGWGKTHDLNRSKDGIFDKIIKNMEILNKKRKKMLVDIKTLVLKNNLEDLFTLYKYCTEMKFEYLSVSFLRANDLKQNPILRDNFGEDFYNIPCDINPYFNLEHFLDVYDRICDLSKKSVTRVRFSPKFEGGTKIQIRNRIKNFFAPENPKDLKKHPSEIYLPCKYPYSNMMINPSGDVYPCLSYKIGNVKEGTLTELFNLPKYRCFRKNLYVQKCFSACQMCCELKVKDKKC